MHMHIVDIFIYFEVVNRNLYANAISIKIKDDIYRTNHYWLIVDENKTRYMVTLTMEIHVGIKGNL